MRLNNRAEKKCISFTFSTIKLHCINKFIDDISSVQGFIRSMDLTHIMPSCYHVVTDHKVAAHIEHKLRMLLMLITRWKHWACTAPCIFVIMIFYCIIPFR